MFLRNILFIDVSGVPEKEQFLVTRLFVYHSPFSFIDNYSSTPSGVMPVYLMRRTNSTVHVNFSIDFSSAYVLSIYFPGLRFPIRSMDFK